MYEDIVLHTCRREYSAWCWLVLEFITETGTDEKAPILRFLWDFHYYNIRILQHFHNVQVS